MRSVLTILTGSVLLTAAVSGSFPFETIQLTEADVGNFSSISFGTRDAAKPLADDAPECRAFPGSSDWPTDEEWKQLNVSLGGALLRPIPVASACYKAGDFNTYNAATCRYLVQQAGRSHFWLDDPLSTLTQWPQGATCQPALNPVGNCTRGGSPEYVVNATTVKHIQAAVNFARNKNVRLVIKNTGHDFGGRSMGAGSLSAWVHNLKSFEFIANYTSDVYSGMAVRIGAGMESWELFNHMGASGNITVVAPGGGTVGAVGGWLASGGHGTLTSKFGLGADQALEINVVTADGQFVTASSTINKDLFWALRGGGPSTYGIMTSVVLKAFPPITMASVPLSFSVNQALTPAGMNFTFPPGLAPSSLNSTATFWKGINIAYRYGTKVLDVGGYCYSYIYPLGNNSFSFTTTHNIPGMETAEISALLQPLFDELNSIGINVTNPQLSAWSSNFYSGGRRTIGTAAPAETRYRSRLFPRRNWEDDELFNETFTAIRRSIEAGYTFHGIAYSPTREVAGSPGADSAVNPAWREAVLHASLMETQPEGISAEQARERDKKVERYLDRWRAVTPGSGAYLNEGDPAEPNWQQSFYGSNYPRLLEVKRIYDPWGLFWARTTVGSEGWEVVTEDGYPFSQNGRLCKVDG
ncbi:hypothetical protein B0H66DRAFT_482832 [Apodospora peruviana]|uniref:FAD-binding PCMH-type domain-containing protein n=1 Tax=Apodospora peruviana TaxID=516989 RepID=A0AAE0M0H6_9PEZI|nr:hypothetical protein B0H66DRAFT_486951 [Apodospora peruviana]KAK3314405.1 hypothetical protein B0H66DRAFT_482832 [Apodospora peruviana]